MVEQRNCKTSIILEKWDFMICFLIKCFDVLKCIFNYLRMSCNIFWIFTFPWFLLDLAPPHLSSHSQPRVFKTIIPAHVNWNYNTFITQMNLLGHPTNEINQKQNENYYMTIWSHFMWLLKYMYIWNAKRQRVDQYGYRWRGLRRGYESEGTKLQFYRPRKKTRGRIRRKTDGEAEWDQWG